MIDRRLMLTGGFATAAFGITSTGKAQAAHYQGDLILRSLPGRMMELQQPFAYAEGPARIWSVPKGATLDGASIPYIFWSLVGGPWDDDYRSASVIHDWYCAVRVQPWRDTHTMFYHAMLTSGVSPKKARMMFLAVYYAGPSWDDLTIANMRMLTQNGKIRPPSRPAKPNGIYEFDRMVSFNPPSTPEEAARINGFAAGQQDTSKLRNNLQKLVEQADAQNLDAEDVIKLVDAHGRDEETATALTEAGLRHDLLND
jgi:hypothetical protein